ARHELAIARHGVAGRERFHEAELRLVVGRGETRVVAQGHLPFPRLGDDAGAWERGRAVRREEASGVVEVEVADRNEIDTIRIESRAPERGEDGVARNAADPAHLLVVALPDARLDEDSSAGRLHEEAVEGLEESPLRVQLVA